MSRNQRIKNALKASGISQDQLAEALGITQGGVGKQLNKDEDIDSLNFIFTVRDLTGYNISYLLNGSEPKKGESESERIWLKEYMGEESTPISSEAEFEYKNDSMVKTLRRQVEHNLDLIDSLKSEIATLKSELGKQKKAKQ